MLLRPELDERVAVARSQRAVGVALQRAAVDPPMLAVVRKDELQRIDDGVRKLRLVAVANVTPSTVQEPTWYSTRSPSSSAALRWSTPRPSAISGAARRRAVGMASSALLLRVSAAMPKRSNDVVGCCVAASCAVGLCGQCVNRSYSSSSPAAPGRCQVPPPAWAACDCAAAELSAVTS